MRGLQEKVVVVTGAAQGIGRAIAERLVEEGAYVAAADRNESVRDVASDLGERAFAVTLDVADRASWQAATDAVVARFRKIDGLVNNAGVTRDRSLLKMSDDDWEMVIGVNLRGTWLGCQMVVPHMKDVGGAIVNISSESRWGAFGQSNYAAAKSGVVGLTRTVAIEHARHNIRVNAVAPGTILTAMVQAVPEEIRNGWLDAIPMRRVGEPSEIASAVSFLLSDDASYVTGQILGVNGGSAL